MGQIKITKKLLDNYRKYKSEIPLLEAEFDGLWMTEKGMGNSVILDYRKGYPRRHIRDKHLEKCKII